MIRSRVQNVRKEQGIAREPPIVIPDEGESQNEDRGQWQQDHTNASAYGIARFYSSCQPCEEPQACRDTKEQALVRSAVRKDGDTEAEKQSIANTGTAQDSRERPQHERAAGGRHSSAPITVHPVACDSQIQCGHHAAKQRPPCRHPCLQHPQNSRAHRATAQKYADPGIAEPLPDSHDEALRRRIHRGIRRKPIHVKRFETHPQGMRGIGQPPVGKRVRH